jgi:hypothetical protein
LIKVCPDCGSTWAGGRLCEDCGTALRDPYAADAADALPKGIWRYIRLQYGARRGMLVRVMAFLAIPVVFGVLARRAIVLDGGLRVLALVGAGAASLLAFLTIYWLAGKAVRIWVLRKGQLNKRRMARALLKRVSR